MLVNIVKADIKQFRKYQGQILEIYLDTGTSGAMEQHLDRETELRYMLSLFDAEGFAYLAFDKNELVGFMLSCSLEHDSLLPNSVRERFPVQRCCYISEMHVSKHYQGKGIGGEMMQRFLDDTDRDKWDYAFIRAWKENTGAIRFYQRHGFVLDAIIEQEKIKKDKKTRFMIHKQYLWQKL